MRHLYRKSFFPGRYESVQDCLELARWYEGERLQFVFLSDEQADHRSLYNQLNRLKREGYLVLEWGPYESQDDDLADAVFLKQISLTTAGHKLLDELRAKSKAGRWKQRLGDLVWVVVTSIVTTLVVLWLSGG